MDTGIGYNLINSAGSSFCRIKNNGCDKYGTIDTTSETRSKTLRRKKEGKLSIGFDGGQGVVGTPYSDDFNIGGRKVTSADFALVTQSNFNYNILGLGYPFSGYSSLSIPQTMKKNGLIKSNAFSIWLNSVHAATGSIIFGGFDKGKFSGSLLPLPVQKLAGQYAKFYVMLEGISATVNDKPVPDVKTERYAVIIDPGYTYTYLPLSLARPIWKAAGVRSFSKTNNKPLISCQATTEFALYFSFGSGKQKKRVSVPMSQLIISNPDDRSLPKGQCYFGIFALGNYEPTSYLGETFMRSAYVVFDQTNNEVSLAQATYTGSSRIIELDDRGVKAVNFAEGEGDDDGQTEADTGDDIQPPDDEGADTQATGVPDNDMGANKQVSGLPATANPENNAGEITRGKAVYSVDDINQAKEPENNPDSMAETLGTSTARSDSTSLDTGNTLPNMLSTLLPYFPNILGGFGGNSDSESIPNPRNSASSDASNRNTADTGQVNLNAFNAKNTDSTDEGNSKGINLDLPQLPNQDPSDLASNDFFSPLATDSPNSASSQGSGKPLTDSDSDSAPSGKTPPTEASGSDKLALGSDPVSDIFFHADSAKAKRSPKN